MNKDNFGSIMYDGKIVDINKTEVEKLEEISKKLHEKHKILDDKIVTVFKQ